jgi:glycosyltransferase involved in cell wall biosynthesis
MIKPIISIITVSYNSRGTIIDTIKSVLSQTYPEIEYIIIDGVSVDGTKEIIDSFKDRISKYIREPDTGLYDAINKGIRIATGDIIGVLHSDDFFYDNNVVEKIAKAFYKNDIDAVFGDVRFIDRYNLSKTVRYYSSKHFKPLKFRFGFMPPHPSFYVKRELFEKLGYYKTNYKIAADFELEMRFLLTNHVRYSYLELPFVSMRTGGISNKSIFSNITLNKEIFKACRENGVRTNYFFIYSKYFTKIFQFFGKKVTH